MTFQVLVRGIMGKTKATAAEAVDAARNLIYEAHILHRANREGFTKCLRESIAKGK